MTDTILPKISYKMVRLMGIHQKKHFTIVKRGPKVVGREKFRFDIFVLLVEEWLKRKLRVQIVVECLR